MVNKVNKILNYSKIDLILPLLFIHSYTFSLLSVPYFLVQLLLVMLALSSVGLLVAWRKDLTFLWPTYHASKRLLLYTEMLVQGTVLCIQSTCDT